MERIHARNDRSSWHGAGESEPVLTLAPHRWHSVWSCCAATLELSIRQWCVPTGDGSMDSMSRHFRCDHDGSAAMDSRKSCQIAVRKSETVIKVTLVDARNLDAENAKSWFDDGSLTGGTGVGCGGFAFGGFGIFVSPSTMLTKQYSMRAINTNIVHTDMNASTAFRYETGGRDACDLACCVDNVSNDVTPNVTRAGAASGLIQNDTHFERAKHQRENIR